MQLIIVSLTLFFLVLTSEVKAQFLKKIKLFNRQQVEPNDTTEMLAQSYEATDWQTIDINFLSSYYVQDGNNAAVTGGIGDEHLTDFTNKVILSVPLKRNLTINADGGADYYTSASTDNINTINASASRHDVRVHGNIGLTYQKDDQHTLSFRAGGSVEYDYTSVSGGINYGFITQDKNTQINLGVQAFIDNWEIIYPSELRGDGPLVPTSNRNSFNGALDITQVINKRMQISFMLEATYMNGLLSTPFHRVFFQDQNQARVEQLPASRLKIPVATRLNAYLHEKLLLRAYYRYYWDDWGVTAHTASIELPVKINRFLSIYPFYRYHQQTAANYFAPFKEHLTSEKFYTSDYDLSALTSHAYGLGLSYAPAGGFFKSKSEKPGKRKFNMTSLDLKYSHYQRSTGLNANIISLGLGFKF